MTTDTIWSLAALAIAIACYAGARRDADRRGGSTTAARTEIRQPMNPARCTTCNHLPHPGRQCRVKRIDGPPSTKGHRVGNGYEHTGRNETQCDCRTYQPPINGVDPL